MAEEAETGGERTEEPSQRRLQEARERGQVPRSRELTTFAAMIGGSVALAATSSDFAGRMAELMRRFMSIDVQQLEDTQSMFSSLREAATLALSALSADFRRARHRGRARRNSPRRVELQPRRAHAGLHASEPLERVEAVVRIARRIGARQGAAEMRGGRGRRRGHRDVALPAGARLGPHVAERGDRPRCRIDEHRVRVAVRIARPGCRRRRTASAVPVQAHVAHDAAGSARRGEGERRASGDQAAESARRSRRSRGAA